MPGTLLAVPSLLQYCEHFILKDNMIKECELFPTNGVPLSSLSLQVLQHHVWELACPLRELLCPSAWQTCSGQVSVLLLDVVCGKQCGIGTGYFNGIGVTQSSLSAQLPRTHVFVHGKPVGTMAGISSCSMSQPDPRNCVQTILKLLWKMGRRRLSHSRRGCSSPGKHQLCWEAQLGIEVLQ